MDSGVFPARRRMGRQRREGAAQGETRASQFAVLLYLLLNIVYAAGSFPSGYFADRMSKKNLLALGYSVFALACVASIYETPSILTLITIFELAGLQTAIVD